MVAWVDTLQGCVPTCSGAPNAQTPDRPPRPARPARPARPRALSARSRCLQGNRLSQRAGPGRESPGPPFLLASAPNRARTPDSAAAAASSMAAAPRAPLRIEFARVRARSGLQQHRLCVRLLPAVPCQGLSKNPWTLATGWSWGGIHLSRGAPPTTPGSRPDACSCKP